MRLMIMDSMSEYQCAFVALLHGFRYNERNYREGDETMDWVMCLLPMAVCFVGVLFSVKVSKKHKRILAAAGVMLFLCVAFGSLAVYRVQKITKPIRESDTLAVAEMNLNSFRGDVEMNDLQTDASTELYQALEEYLGKKLYLPCINQDTFDAGGQDVVLQFGSDDEAKVWLAFYADSRICLVNGKKAYVFPGGKAVYQEIEEILASVSTYTAVTVTAIDEKNDFLMAEEKNGKLYAFHKVSEKLRTKSGKQAKLEDLAVGDELTVLSDGRVLLSDPYQIENIYQIYT